MSEPFTAGDVVRLKSGGPAMTVQSIHDRSVECIWWDPALVGVMNSEDVDGYSERWFLVETLTGRDVGPTDAPDYAPDAPSPHDGVLVADLNLSVRSTKILHRSNIDTVGQLRHMTPDDLLDLRNFGNYSLEEVRDKLRSLGLGLLHARDARPSLPPPPRVG